MALFQFHERTGRRLHDGVHGQLPQRAGILLPGRAAEGVHRHLRVEAHRQRRAAVLLH